MWPRVAQAMVGIWLMVAPAVLEYRGAVATSDRVVGPVTASLAIVSAWAVLRSVRWAIVPIALWIAVVPLVLPAEGAAAVSEAVSAGLLLILTPPGGSEPQRFGGGWRSLLRA